MTRALEFYPVYKDRNTNRYRPLLYNTKKNPADIMWRSEKRIDIEFFTHRLSMISKGEIGKEFDWILDRINDRNDATYAFELPIDLLVKHANNGIVSGYALLDDALAYYKHEWPTEYLHNEMKKPISAEVYAELPEIAQRDYIKFQAIDTYSIGYVASILLEVIDDLYVPFDDAGDICILVDYFF